MPDICFVIIDHNLLVRDDKPVVKCLVNVIIGINVTDQFCAYNKKEIKCNLEPIQTSLAKLTKTCC